MSSQVIDTAFRSSKPNECYVFKNKRFAVVNYAPGAKKDHVVKKPIHTSDGFPFLDETPFEKLVDCAFETEGTQAIIFSGKQCAKIDFAPDSDTDLLDGPVPITTMFHCLKGTFLENGIDAAIKWTGHNVFLFKGNEYVRMDYHSKTIVTHYSIRSGFKSLLGTVFENGIDAAFASHVANQAYVFKGEYYARIDISNEGDCIVNGRVKLVHDEWPALQSLLNF